MLLEALRNKAVPHLPRLKVAPLVVPGKGNEGERKGNEGERRGTKGNEGERRGTKGKSSNPFEIIVRRTRVPMCVSVLIRRR